MLFCPNCGAGWEDQDTCPNCNERLSPRFDEQQMQSPLVVIEDKIDKAYLQMAKELLEQNGIFCILKHAFVDDIVAGKMETAVLWVPEVKAQEAKELIAAYFEEQGEKESQKVCPQCGAVMPDYKIICPDCGKVFEE
jgi:predicted amidophosphoribosyltransferase